MTILSKLLSCKKNTDILTNSVPEDVYGALVRTLALPDISVSSTKRLTEEFFYELSGLIFT